jgi:AcrR family transcriptional regulator
MTDIEKAPPRQAQGKRLLMEAAARLAARQGGATSLVLRELAREAGLNHNTFYRHFESIEAMMASIVEDFGTSLRSGLLQARESVLPGQPPSPVVVAWLFDFAREHCDVFTVAMREQYGPDGPVRDAVRGMLDQLREDMLADLTRLGHLPALDKGRLRRLLRISIDQVFRLCLDYLEAPRRRAELLRAAKELFDTLVAGAMVLESKR